MRRLTGFACLTAATAGCLLATPAAQALAEPTVATEQICVAAGMTLPPRLQAVVYNRHPQSKTESRVEVDVTGTARRLPGECIGTFVRRAFAQVQFRSSTSGQRWIPAGKAWESLGLEFVPPVHEFQRFGEFWGIGFDKRRRNLGCVLQSQLRLKLELVEEATGRVVAARFAEVPGEVDLWRSSRCLGQLSIRDEVTPCRQTTLGAAGQTPHLWTIAVRRSSCAGAALIARIALQRGFAEAGLTSQRVRGWHCVYSQDSAAACMQGSRRIYLRTRDRLGHECPISGVRESLLAARASCATGRAVRAAAAEDAPGDRPATHRVSGRSWQCFAFSVAPFVAHRCYGGSALVTFGTLDRRYAVPQPTVIPADVIYPGNGASAIARTPFLRIEEWFIEDDQVELEVLAEDSLAGQTAHLEVGLSRWRCGQDLDPDPLGDGPSCGRVRRIGEPVERQLTLQASQRIPIGRIRRDGNWSYDVRITTESFSVGNVLYGPAKATTSYLMLYGS
ncbi:MAG: hypothetical protein ABW196_09160 [Solirubrobacterales bacterium]